MTREGAPIYDDHEQPRAVSMERTSSGSVSIRVTEEKFDDFYGFSMTIDRYLEDKGLFEVITNDEDHTIEVRPLNPVEEISDDVFGEIKKQVDVFNQ
ncbi:hypothetical protein H7Y21_01685 [Arenimonas sp.]|nr:hypothetical protein [Candidatus Parcubacteria bacterium]